MAGPCTKFEDIACNDSGPGENEKSVDFPNGNDSGLGEETCTAEDLLTASGPKLMFRCQIRNNGNI